MDRRQQLNELSLLPTRLHQNRMKKLFLLLLFCHLSSAVKHSLKFFLTGSSGVPNVPEFVAAAQVDDVTAGYCDTNTKTVKPKQDWVKDYFRANPQQLQWYNRECSETQPQILKSILHSFMQLHKHGGGVLQLRTGCEWDETSEEVTGFMLFGYDGEDFMAFDLKTLSWIALKPEAVPLKQRWDADVDDLKSNRELYNHICPELLKMSVIYGKSFLLRTELPSVSLLQKSPSSPVSCHATGFYPDRALMLWRKDGEDLHEDVDQGEILPNHDGSFQMRVDLDLSSVKPEDWGRYDCVFQLSGVKEEIITKLDKAVIRSNSENPSNMTVPIIAAVVGVALILIAVTGFMVYRKKKAKHPPSSPENGTELCEKLNPET